MCVAVCVSLQPLVELVTGTRVVYGRDRCPHFGCRADESSPSAALGAPMRLLRKKVLWRRPKGATLHAGPSFICFLSGWVAAI